METKTHWKSLVNVNYLGAYSLMDGSEPKDLNVKIAKVLREKVKGEGGKEEECTVAYIENNKPLIINRTNAKTITKLVGSPFIEDWVGKTVTIFVSKTKVAGETVDCLRIRPTLPALYGKEEAQLRNCKSLDELKAVFSAAGFPQQALCKLKDELKLKLK
jgi:hypothetical protein